MSENLTKNIRLSTSVKNRLDAVRGTGSCSSYICKMLDFFDKSNFNLRRSCSNSDEKIIKRLEDLIKIVKSQERDMMKPLFNKVMEGEGNLENEEKLKRMANENHRLHKEVVELRKEIEKSLSSEEKYRLKLQDLVNLINYQCDPKKFNTVVFSEDLKVSPSFFKKLKIAVNRYLE